MAEFILKDWYGKEQTFDKDSIFVKDKDGQLLQFTNAAVESEEMIYYRSLAETLMTRNAEKFTDDSKVMHMKNFIMSDGKTLGSLNSYSFAGFKNVEGMSFSGVGMVLENAFYDCQKLKVIDMTSSAGFPMVAFLDGSLNNCPSIESIIIRAGETGLTTASVLKTHGSSNDEFYVYVPSSYYDTVMANWNENMIPENRYRKLEEYPSVDRWYESYVVQFYDSDGSTLLRTEEYVYGTIPSYTPTKSGYEFAGWIPEPAMVTGPASYTANWVEKVTFATATWEQISAITTEGTSASKFAVGDIRTELLTYSDGSTENVEFAIAKIRSDGSMVLVPTHALATQKPMHTSISQSSPTVYNNSFGKHLTDTVFPALPEDFRAVIRNATYMFGKRNIRPLSADNLYVNGEKENTDSFYESLPLFSTAAKRIRKINGTPVTYWTGTYATTSSNYYYYGYIDASGSYKDPKTLGGADGVTANRGVVFAVDV